MNRGNPPGGRPARRRKVATRQVRHVYGQGAAAEDPPEAGYPFRLPGVRQGLAPLRFPAGVRQLAAADFCGAVTFNGYYGDPPAD